MIGSNEANNASMTLRTRKKDEESDQYVIITGRWPNEGYPSLSCRRASRSKWEPRAQRFPPLPSSHEIFSRRITLYRASPR
jgi:hypothetical protein